MDDASKWVLVPTKPTAQMEQAGSGYIFEDGINYEARCDAASHVYRVMLAAAPAQPSQAGLPDREELIALIKEHHSTITRRNPKTFAVKTFHRGLGECADAILASIRSPVGEGENAATAAIVATGLLAGDEARDAARAALTAISGGPHADAS